jgi:hypothetical protein
MHYRRSFDFGVYGLFYTLKCEALSPTLIEQIRTERLNNNHQPSLFLLLQNGYTPLQLQELGPELQNGVFGG